MSCMKMKCLLSLWCMCLAVACLSTARGATHIVGMTSQNRFLPAVTNILVGDTIIFTNNTANGHTVTPTNNNEAFCGTGNLPPNATCSYTFNTPGSFRYYCIPHFNQFFTMTGLVVVASPPNTPPSVTITNPANNSIFAAPGAFTIRASATDSDGTVTNVAFLTNNVLITNVRTAPFNLAVSNVPAGAYSLTARATDNAGAFTTSPAVTVRVVTAPQIKLLTPSSGPIRFEFSSATGVSYVVEGATRLTNFASIVTNPGSGSAIQYTATNNNGSNLFYRVRVQP